MPNLSVIMTMYNAERFLREAIESILNQVVLICAYFLSLMVGLMILRYCDQS